MDLSSQDIAVQQQYKSSLVFILQLTSIPKTKSVFISFCLLQYVQTDCQLCSSILCSSCKHSCWIIGLRSSFSNICDIFVSILKVIMKWNIFSSTLCVNFLQKMCFGFFTYNVASNGSKSTCVHVNATAERKTVISSKS